MLIIVLNWAYIPRPSLTTRIPSGIFPPKELLLLLALLWERPREYVEVEGEATRRGEAQAKRN